MQRTNFPLGINKSVYSNSIIQDPRSKYFFCDSNVASLNSVVLFGWSCDCVLSQWSMCALPVHVERMMQWSMLGLQLTVISRQWWALWCCADLSSGLNCGEKSSRGQPVAALTDNASSFFPPTTSTLDSPYSRRRCHQYW